MDLRKALLEKIARLDQIDSAHFPVVGIDDYFIGNDREDSIAPNQWGDGRPPIAEIYARLKAIEARPDVQGVFVGIHQDWPDADRFNDWAPAENIHIYSSAPQHIADQWVEGLLSDGIGPGWPCTASTRPHPSRWLATRSIRFTGTERAGSGRF